MAINTQDFLVIPKHEVEQLYTMKDAIENQEHVFQMLGLGKAWVLPIIYHDVHQYDGLFALKPGVITEPPVSGLKLVCINPKNPETLPRVNATILIHDMENGTPLAIMDGLHITAVRTAAAGAVAARHLARKDSRKVGVLGTGIQGRVQVLALKEIFKIDEVKAWSPTEKNRRRYADKMQCEIEAPVYAVASPREAVTDVDILITATNATESIVMNDWVTDGLHINGIGADHKGKQEIDTAIYARAKLVVDKREIALHKDHIKPEQIHAELGEVVAGNQQVVYA